MVLADLALLLVLGQAVDPLDLLSTADKARLAPIRTALLENAAKLGAEKKDFEAAGKAEMSEVEERAYIARGRELEGRIVEQGKRTAEYRRDLHRGLGEEKERVNARMATTRKGIEDHAGSLKDYTKSLEEWAELATDARKDVRKKAVALTLTALLEACFMKLDASNLKARDLAKNELERVDALLKNKILGHPQLEKLPELRARLFENVQAVRRDRDVLQILQMLSSHVSVVPEADSDDREILLAPVLELISIVSPHPGVSTLTASLDLLIAEVYCLKAGALAKERIEQLLEVGDKQLQGLSSLTSLYKKDVDRRRAIVREMEKLEKR